MVENTPPSGSIEQDNPINEQVNNKRQEGSLTLKPNFQRRAPDGYIGITDYSPRNLGEVALIDIGHFLKRNALAIGFIITIGLIVWGVIYFIIPNIPTLLIYIILAVWIISITSGIPQGLALLRRMSKRIFIFIFHMKGTKDIVSIDTQRKYGDNLLWHETQKEGISLRETRDFIVNSGRLNNLGARTVITDQGVQLKFANDFDEQTQTMYGNIVGTPLHYEIYSTFEKPEFVLSPHFRKFLAMEPTGDEQFLIHKQKIKEMTDEGLNKLREAAEYAHKNITNSGNYYVESFENLDKQQQRFFVRMQWNIDTFEPYDKTPKAMLYHAEKYLQDMQLTAERQFELKLERDKIKMEGQEEIMAMISIRPEVNPTLHQMFKDSIKKPLIIKTLEGIPGPLQQQALELVTNAYNMRSVIQEQTEDGEENK
jgi:hypothetical protein